MAPFIGPSRREVVAMLRKRKPPERIGLGHMEPQAIIERGGDGVWRLRRLVRDEAEIKRRHDEAHARGGPFMPEHTWVFTDDGPVLARAPTARELADLIEKMKKWPFGSIK